MSKLILVRHGQSEWNLENRFTGWVDVDLAPKGKLEACKSGELIKEQKIIIDYFFTSFQKRAIETLNLILNTMRIKENEIIRAWELNERHYGSLTGLNKNEMKKKLGEKKVHEFRRSWNISPEPLNKNILISAHGNSLRAICKYLFKLDNNQITKLEIPTGNPLFINFNNKFEIIQCHYLDKERAKNLIAF